MGFIVIAVILGIVILAGVAWSLIADLDKVVGVIVAGIAAVLLVGLTFISSITVVGARSVAVVTAFGSYQGSLKHGTHFIAPWASTEKFSTRLQPLYFGGSAHKDDANFEEKVDVSYGGTELTANNGTDDVTSNTSNGGGDVFVTVQWRTTDTQIQKLWQDYQTLDHVRDRVVAPNSRTAINDVISQYTPVAARDGQNRVEIQDKAKVQLQSLLDRYGVVVDSVTVSQVNLNAAAQASYDSIVTANANITKAQAEQTRAKIDAETNKLRAASLTPVALQRYCLDVMNNWSVAKNGNLPAGFNCSGLSSIPVTIPAK